MRHNFCPPRPQPKDLAPLSVATLGRRLPVEWDPEAPATPLSPLVFFAQFLACADLFASWVRECPLLYHSPNAPRLTDLLGTVLLGVLCGHKRYAPLTALRGDQTPKAWA